MSELDKLVMTGMSLAPELTRPIFLTAYQLCILTVLGISCFCKSDTLMNWVTLVSYFISPEGHQ